MAWWVAQLQPNRTALALGCLARLGYVTYAPRIIEKRTNHGRCVEAEASLFPGYGFVQAVLQWHAAVAAPGIVRLCRQGGDRPATVSDELIERIRARERDGRVVLPERQFRPGVQVRVLTGPFRDHIGIFSDMNGSERVGVLLNLLGAERRVAVLKSHIEVVDS
jgi:transcription antitermination factor NusG